MLSAHWYKSTQSNSLALHCKSRLSWKQRRLTSLLSSFSVLSLPNLFWGKHWNNEPPTNLGSAVGFRVDSPRLAVCFAFQFYFNVLYWACKIEHEEVNKTHQRVSKTNPMKKKLKEKNERKKIKMSLSFLSFHFRTTKIATIFEFWNIRVLFNFKTCEWMNKSIE